MTAFGRSVLLCPFCGAKGGEFPPHELCGGSFLDRDHPSGVRPVLVDLDADGNFYPDTERRFSGARHTYGFHPDKEKRQMTTEPQP